MHHLLWAAPPRSRQNLLCIADEGPQVKGVIKMRAGSGRMEGRAGQFAEGLHHRCWILGRLQVGSSAALDVRHTKRGCLP